MATDGDDGRRGGEATLGDDPAVVNRADLSGGRRVEVCADGRKVTLLCHRGEVRAVLSSCPHGNGRLGDGTIQGDEIVCPLHRWRFDLTTGRARRDPRLPSAVVPVIVDAAGAIRLRAAPGSTP